MQTVGRLKKKKKKLLRSAQQSLPKESEHQFPEKVPGVSHLLW